MHRFLIVNNGNFQNETVHPGMQRNYDYCHVCQRTRKLKFWTRTHDSHREK
eukprot:UN21920